MTVALEYKLPIKKTKKVSIRAFGKKQWVLPFLLKQQILVFKQSSVKLSNEVKNIVIVSIHCKTQIFS